MLVVRSGSLELRVDTSRLLSLKWRRPVVIS